MATLLLSTLLLAVLATTSVHGLYPDVATAVADLKLVTFQRMAQAGGVSLTGPWEGTAFLPVEEGWDIIMFTLTMTMPDILKNPILSRALVMYHLVPTLIIRTSDLSFEPTSAFTALQDQGLLVGEAKNEGGLGNYFYVKGYTNEAVFSGRQDIRTDKGLVNVINKALGPRFSPIIGPFPQPIPDAVPPTILAYIQTQPNLKMFYLAARKCDLLDTLELAHTPYTVFAATNTAMEKAAKQLGLKTFAKLLLKPRAYLSNILLNTVVIGAAYQPEQLTDLLVLATRKPSTILVRNDMAGTITLRSPSGVAAVIGEVTYIGPAAMYEVDGLLMAGANPAYSSS